MPPWAYRRSQLFLSKTYGLPTATGKQQRAQQGCRNAAGPHLSLSGGHGGGQRGLGLCAEEEERPCPAWAMTVCPSLEWGQPPPHCLPGSGVTSLPSWWCI